MVHAIRLSQTGGPEVLHWEEISLPTPGPQEALIRQTAIGLNYIDIYHRTGLYPVPLPSGLGLEGAGIVEAIGSDVSDLSVGDRVAYAGPPIGAYAEQRIMPAAVLVPLPETVSEDQAAALMLQGMTVEYLLHRTYKLEPGQTLLIHAAAGGVGLLLCQWAHHIGATVIGTVGSPEKAALAKENGCHHTILYREENFVDKVKEITEGQGVHVVYDSIGKDTFEGSLDCLRPRGMMVSFGQSSGSIALFDLSMLSQRGSLFITRPSLMAYTASRDDLLASAQKLFTVIGKGAVKPHLRQRFALKDAATAHHALESRTTLGSSILVP